MNVWRSLTAVNTTDPDDARRRGLLNILLFGVAVISLLILVATFLGQVSSDPLDNQRIELSIGGLLVGSVVIYLINRFVAGWLASVLFLLLLIVGIAFGDTPNELVSGRSLYEFVVPVIFASILLPAYSTFIFVILTDITIAIIAFSAGIDPNLPAMIGFLIIALVSWLSGRGLENALRDLRLLNSELEQRVQDRTRDLNDSLIREQTETRKNQAILQSIADGVIVFDEHARASVANPAVYGLLEKPESQIIGATVDQLMEGVKTENQVEVKTLFAPSTSLPVPLNVELGGKTLSLSVAPLLAGEAGSGGSVAVFRDVTREAEISRMKSIIVAMVSHELRTPLNAVQGLAEILQQGVYGQLSEKQQQTIERLMINTQRLMKLVHDLLDQAQIEAGTLKMEQVEFSPADLLESVREVVAPLAQQKNLAFELSVDPDLPKTLLGDTQRLGQILINLSTNAIKFTEKGSVKIHLYQLGLKQWAMEVADTGPGIPISAEAYIFDAFRQVDSSAGRKHGGIGLGLSIVKRLVNVMGGDIKLSSRIGRGSTFSVLLPLLQPEPHLIAA